MDFLVDRLAFLGLNDREVRVFTTLATFGPMNMTKLSSHARLPRTTVDAIVRRLIERNVVSRIPVKKHYEYCVDLEHVADTLDWIEQRLRPRDTSANKYEKSGREEALVHDDSVEKVLQQLFLKQAGDRVRILTARTQDGLSEAVERIVGYVREACAHNTKLEILLCAQVADAVRNSPLRNDSLEKYEQIHFNIVPSLYCASETDTIIFPNSVVLRSIRKNSMRCVEDREVVDSMKHLLDIACETGWSITLSAWLQ